MKNVIITLIIILGICPLIFSQNVYKMEGNIGFGFTLVDAWEYAEIPLKSEGHGAYQINVKVFFINYGKMEFGGEIGYQKLFDYSFKECSNCYTAYRTVDALKLVATARKPIYGKLDFEFYLGGYIYQGYFAIGTGAAVLYRISLGEKFYLPVKLRGDIIIDTDAPMVPLGLEIGLGYKLIH